MGIMKDRRPIAFNQVCAIARVVLLRQPNLSDSEWKASTREVIAKQGYDEPQTDMLSRALTQVEQALRQTIGRRPVDEHKAPSQPAKPSAPAEPTRQEYATMIATVRGVIARSAAATGLPDILPAAREILHITEHAALDQFYAEANAPGGDKLAALKRFAELAIEREATWNKAEIRETSGQHHLHAYACFACRAQEVRLDWHHIIQIQHGGSNLYRNRVALCGACHSDIHPWMPKKKRSQSGGWWRLGGIDIPLPGKKTDIA
jgi:hypothetical protein